MKQNSTVHPRDSNLRRVMYCKFLINDCGKAMKYCHELRPVTTGVHSNYSIPKMYCHLLSQIMIGVYRNLSGCHSLSYTDAVLDR